MKAYEQPRFRQDHPWPVHDLNSTVGNVSSQPENPYKLTEHDAQMMAYAGSWLVQRDIVLNGNYDHNGQPPLDPTELNGV